ncbi:MAG TPA: HNH endonuclease [Luteitalea sp.]|nr:HNH endonuclease [Luteitalea sp.]
MAARLQRLFLRVVATDSRAARGDDGIWTAPCLHCQSPCAVHADGRPLGATTLEHIVPRSWFGRVAARELTARVGDPDVDANLALACARCNQQKGKTHDADGPSNPRAREVVANLLDRRTTRLRQPVELA